jgi:hypothetical protein
VFPFQADFFLSARSSASAGMIAISFFASGMGAWVMILLLNFHIFARGAFGTSHA